jgi:hypothetical protein
VADIRAWLMEKDSEDASAQPQTGDTVRKRKVVRIFNPTGRNTGTCTCASSIKHISIDRLTRSYRRRLPQTSRRRARGRRVVRRPNGARLPERKRRRAISTRTQQRQRRKRSRTAARRSRRRPQRCRTLLHSFPGNKSILKNALLR